MAFKHPVPLITNNGPINRIGCKDCMAESHGISGRMMVQCRAGSAIVNYFKYGETSSVSIVGIVVRESINGKNTLEHGEKRVELEGRNFIVRTPDYNETIAISSEAFRKI